MAGFLVEIATTRQKTLVLDTEGTENPHSTEMSYESAYSGATALKFLLLLRFFRNRLQGIADKHH